MHRRPIPTVLLAGLVLCSIAGCRNGSRNPGSGGDRTADAMRSLPWREIAPTDVDINTVKMIDKDWMVVSAGKEGDMNMMTISWGGLGELWNKPVFTVYVSTSRYTNSFMERNDYFTVTHFPESMRDKLSYLGRVSGRDEDKVAGSGLAVEFTELGNPIYAEADLAFECRKIYASQFDRDALPVEVRQWYDNNGLGIHYMYVGEIVHVWRK